MEIHCKKICVPLVPLTPKLPINLTHMIYFLARLTYYLTQAHQSIPSHETECSCQIVLTYSNFAEGTTDPRVECSWQSIYLKEIQTNVKKLLASCCSADIVVLFFLSEILHWIFFCNPEPKDYGQWACMDYIHSGACKGFQIRLLSSRLRCDTSKMQPPSWGGNYIDDWRELRREENEKQTFLTWFSLSLGIWNWPWVRIERRSEAIRGGI